MKTEADLWTYLKPNLRGHWRRQEQAIGSGIPDCVGLWNNQTWWLELKIGKPQRKALRPGQVDFYYECQRHGVPWHVCFWHRGEAKFFSDLTCASSALPKFYRLTD